MKSSELRGAVELLAVAQRYLRHPDVEAMPFCLHSSAVAIQLEVLRQRLVVEVVAKRGERAHLGELMAIADEHYANCECAYEDRDCPLSRVMKMAVGMMDEDDPSFLVLKRAMQKEPAGWLLPAVEDYGGYRARGDSGPYH